MADLYPVFLNLEGKQCLVVGGGNVALRKVQGLLDAGARVTVIAPEVNPGIEALASEGNVMILKRSFQPEIVEGQWLVFGATDDRKVNQAVFDACEQVRVLANVADDPPLCRFHVPSRYTEGMLQVAVSTGGGSPAFCARLSREFGSMLSPWAPRLVEWLDHLRGRLKERIPDDPKRRGVFLKSLMQSHIRTLRTCAKENDRKAFETLVDKELGGFGP